jgi:hypothetical protein
MTRNTLTVQPRHLLRAYTSRRSPWGPPWWIYGVAFGAANLIRSVVVIVSGAETSQPMRIAAWSATAIVVITVVNGVAVLLARRGDAAPRAHALAPLWPLRRDGRVPEQVVEQRQPREPAPRSTTWAPWWIYLVAIVGANAVRRAVVGDLGAPAVRVVVALAFSAALFVAVTAIHRAGVARK